jgi:hypothetical protein
VWRSNCAICYLFHIVYCPCRPPLDDAGVRALRTLESTRMTGVMHMYLLATVPVHAELLRVQAATGAYVYYKDVRRAATSGEGVFIKLCRQHALAPAPCTPIKRTGGWGLPMLARPLKRNGGKGEPRYLGFAGPPSHVGLRHDEIARQEVTASCFHTNRNTVPNPSIPTKALRCRTSL